MVPTEVIQSPVGCLPETIHTQETSVEILDYQQIIHTIVEIDL